MADEVKYQQQHHETKIDEPCCEAPAAAAATPKAEDRGLFDFLGKKEEEEKKCDQVGEVVIVSEFEEKAKICEKPKHKKLPRSGSSSSSSSSDEEEEDENGEKKKKKKGLKEKIKEKISGGGEKEDITAVSIEKCEDDHVDEKKGFLDKIKEKLPGGKKTEEVAAPPQSSPAEECSAVPEAEGKEKKGLLDKIKEKLPGYHPRSDEEKEKEACH